MSYKVLRDNYYTPGLGPSEEILGIRYNPETGDYELKQKGALGYDVGIGLKIFYRNGSWTGEALEDPKLFENKDPKKPTAEAKRIALQINQIAYNAYDRLGRASKGNKINSSALPENQNNMGVSNQFSGVTQGIVSGVTELVGDVSDLIKLFSSSGLPDFGDFPNIPNPAFAKVLKYPQDLLENGQDTLHITQVEYQSPNLGIFAPDSFDKILKEGFARNSVAKTRLDRRVILPIPNNAQDGNTVNWGQDNLNPIMAAMTSKVINETGSVAGTVALAGAGSLAANMMNKPGLGNMMSKFPQAAAMFQILSKGNPSMVKPALFSFLLERLGIDVPPETILSRGLGVVPNSNLQLLFNNVELRSFNFSYMMTPRNEIEAKDINMILRFFKQGMAAKKLSPQAGGPSIILGTPNVFKLEYKSGSKNIKSMNKFKICALTSFNVNYVPTGQWAAYDEGQPASVVMTMAFREIEPVYESDYQQVEGDLSFDLPSVSNEDIGY